MNLQNIIGKLKVTKPEQINESTHHNIWLALSKHSFFAVVEPSLWDHGILKVNRQAYVTDGKTAATEFINKLAAFLIEDGIPQLGLIGEITLVTTGEEYTDSTVLHRILVKDNQALYSQASLKWENYTVAETPAYLA